MHKLPFVMTLSQLLVELAPQRCLEMENCADLEINGLCDDSRRVQPGDLFVALGGLSSDGRQFVEQAIAKGAVAVIIESEARQNSMESVAQLEGRQFIHWRDQVPVIELTDLRDKLSALADTFFHHPSADLSVIGVTGTNGKTTCAWLLAGLLAHFNVRAGLIGTLGCGVVEAQQVDLESTGFTTPDAIFVQSCLSSLKQRNCSAVAMEVSSHALSQSRVAAVNFKAAIFTNLSRDHLDFHGDMHSYAAAKRILFDTQGLVCAVINVDDATGRELIQSLNKNLQIISCSTRNNVADVYVKNIRCSMSGTQADVYTPWGHGLIQTCLIGEFNLNNILLVLSAIVAEGCDFNAVLEAIKKLDPVPGRMQIVEPPTHATAVNADTKQSAAPSNSAADITVVVDYAHTPDALSAALQALRPHAVGNLWLIFGAGGERDNGKRALMGEIAEQYADRVILTNDNPRNESPQNIVTDIQAGIRELQNIQVELDRNSAITCAIEQATCGDVVLIAGKGHEDYQLVGSERIYFSDYEVAERELSRRCAA
jgi:UDP-N-acetylmuramoyl-L-alanyl-D-glutamate--2,6-diaminopimelate ligase